MTTPAPRAPHAKGDELPERRIEISREDLRRYAEASGDHNPIHLDDDSAQALGLSGVIAHGMLVMAMAVGSVAEWAGGADEVLSTEVRFAAPVPVPADAPAVLHVAAAVRSVDDEAESATVALAVTVDGVKVLGKAVVTIRRLAG